jgi:hypothetical protein
LNAVWIRGRAYATGDTWFRRLEGALVAEEPDPLARGAVEALDPHLPSLALLRAGDGRFAVVLTGYETAQRRKNAPRVTASFVFVGEEQECRRLAATLVEGLTKSPEASCGAQLTAKVIDGLDTVTFRVADGFDAIVQEATSDDRPASGGRGLPTGHLARTEATLRDVADALAGAAELPRDEVPLVVTGSFNGERLAGRMPASLVAADGAAAAEGQAPAAAEPTATTAEAEELSWDEPVEPEPERVIEAGPARPSRLVSGVVNVLALAGAFVTLALYVIAARALVDLAEDARGALGFDPPADGIDWFKLAALLLVLLVPVVGLAVLARLVRIRFDRRLDERLGGRRHVRRFSPRASWDRPAWMAELLETPYWKPRAEQWRGEGRLDVPRSAWTADHYRQAAGLVAAELDDRLGRVALATGLAVAIAQRRVADAAVVVAGSAELQVEALATLGLRPRPAAWLHIGRAAATGLLVSTYVDVEERFEIQLAVRSAALGLDSSGGLLEDAEDDVQDALGELLEGTGGIGKTLAVVGGASFGLSGNVIRQVSDFVAEIGDEIAEGVIVAAVLHYHAMALVASALAADEEHHAELAPRIGHVPQSLKNTALRLARAKTADLRRMLRDRLARGTRSLGGGMRDRLLRRRRTT